MSIVGKLDAISKLAFFYQISYFAISTKIESAQNWSQRLLLCRYCKIHSHALLIWIIDSMLFCSPNFRVLNSFPFFILPNTVQSARGHDAVSSASYVAACYTAPRCFEWPLRLVSYITRHLQHMNTLSIYLFPQTNAMSQLEIIFLE